LIKEDTFEVKKECCYILSNSFSKKSTRICDILISKGAFDIIITVLKMGDKNLVDRGLEALKYIFEAGDEEHRMISNTKGSINRYCILFDEKGGLDVLEELQDHFDQYI
jgi:hypothetical protein